MLESDHATGARIDLAERLDVVGREPSSLT